MHYYLVIIINRNTHPLTYQSEKIINKFDFVQVPLRKKINLALVIEEVQKPNFVCEEIIINETLGYLTKDYFNIAKFISSYYHCPISTSLKLFKMGFKISKAPIKLNLKNDIILSNKQNAALQFCQDQFCSLLFADTGSGKTEIYIKAIQSILSKGKNALLLVPEIALTPQLIKRLEKYFKPYLALWHHKITAKNKQRTLNKIYNDEVRIVAGTMSALFLPLQYLGLIIIDEEHDDSFKASQQPSYHTRDLAIYMAKQLKAKIILGSATPALSSFYKFPYFRLKGNYFNSQNNYNFVTNFALEYYQKILKENFEANHQAIVFLPTRANYKFLFCMKCKTSIECPYCSVSMSLHIDRGYMKCHYCSLILSIPNYCDTCKNTDLISERMGTMEFAKHLKSYIPQANIEVLDSDAAKTVKTLDKLLKDFNNQKIHILVGTQMLSKGHNYHHVTLALILDIDYVLHQASFRASEKAVALAVQISGRAGRKNNGRAIIQSTYKDYFQNYINDYELFLQKELKLRKALYPPFQRLARIVFSHSKNEVAKNNMQESLALLKQTPVNIIGSGPCTIGKIANKFRYQILLRSKSFNTMSKALHQIPKENNFIDIDPVNFH